MSTSKALEVRREQNRIAQRKHRSKMRELIRSRSNQIYENNNTKLPQRKTLDASRSMTKSKEEGLASSSPLSENKSERNSSQVSSIKYSTGIIADTVDKSTFIHTLLLYATSPVQSSNICLPRFQLAQALSNNAERIGIPNNILTNYWSISTIQEGWERNKEKVYFQMDNSSKSTNIKRLQTCLTVEDDFSASQWKFDRVPKNMLPTAAQLCIEHHPYIDCVFPWASMRSKILLFMENVFTEEQLCQETLTSHERYGEPAFTVWGDDPMDENSWEVSESFATNWWFLLDRGIINRTNWWRRQQEKPELSKLHILE